MIYEEHTGVLRRCFFDVQNEIGLGRREEAYHEGCRRWLSANRVRFHSRPRYPLCIAAETVHTLIPDFVINDSITVELKALPRKLNDTDLVQLFDYLKVREDRLGLMVNLGLDRAHIKRIAYSPPEYVLQEDWSRWKRHVDSQVRRIGIVVRDALKTVFREHQTGFGQATTYKLILASLRSRGLTVAIRPRGATHYQDAKIDESDLDCLLIEGRVLLVVTALFEDNRFNISRGISFMNSLNIHWGIAANFGRKKAEINGLRA